MKPSQFLASSEPPYQSPLVRRTQLATAAVALVLMGASEAQAQVCQTGLLDSYYNTSACSIGNVGLSWSQGGLISNVFSSAVVTPISGSSALGSYFGFRFSSAGGAPLMSKSISAADARVPNPAFDPANPTQGPQYLSYLQHTTVSSILNWTFTPTLSAQTRLTRLQVTTSGASARSVSQLPIQPVYFSNGEPDMNSGCGWEINDPVTNQWYYATQVCGGFSSGNNNYLTLASQPQYAQAVWSSISLSQPSEYRNDYCLENGAIVNTTATSCTSFLDLSGVALGAPISYGLVATTYAMGSGEPAGLIDETDPNYSSYGGQVEVGEAEFRIYYQSNVVPEPGTWALMAVGLGGLMLMTRRRRV